MHKMLLGMQRLVPTKIKMSSTQSDAYRSAKQLTGPRQRPTNHFDILAHYFDLNHFEDHCAQNALL